MYALNKGIVFTQFVLREIIFVYVGDIIANQIYRQLIILHVLQKSSISFVC